MTKKSRLTLWLGISTATVVATLGGTYLWQHTSVDRGTFGDMFGAAAACFSGFGLVALVGTLVLQAEVLESQQEQIEILRRDFGQRQEGVDKELQLFRKSIRTSTLANIVLILLRQDEAQLGKVRPAVDVEKYVKRLMDELESQE